ncbi:peptide chain release factor N(5)-glutamine methyltransferase [bacterium]|nr:peptide chain release factor N(5)-glutamine methyltransferase [bacterium]
MNELELILTDIFKCSRTNLYLNASSVVFKKREFKSFDRILRNRGRGIPLQYILGYTEFMGLGLKVKKGVLIPRPETEILVETIIEKTKNLRLSAKGEKTKNLTILDIGTGSGCIAIALAKFLERVDIIATDISKEALDLARENAQSHNVVENINFLQSDFFIHHFFKTKIKFDIIVSNPPYVPTFEIGIFDNTTAKEPKVALNGGIDGLDFYRRLSKYAGKFLRKGGLLFLELGYGQAEKVKEIFSQGWTIEGFKKDYQGIERVCIINYG